MSCITTLAGGAKLYTDISELHIHDWYTEVKEQAKFCIFKQICP